ncbi:LOW QUALITY PROTEIN: solute carrier family 66 member 3-like [Pollicipes pollicipes]|uniref:LOW QUALITY PROTEIN: solute carrier family 66 member 3-like n=1 Tax=Pollicipes pollicipes TaxID=41117 RepID=UPI0018857F27|nr:LOW QUALITY PROTEIN: solute carrier family 66 member 3-like [Pollicipes pollicipes]
MAPLVVACDWISIVGSLVLKLPQIAATLRSGSARGLSLQSLLLELTGFTINFCYNAAHGYPLLSYFEYALLIPQDVLLVLLTLRLSGQLTAGWVATLAAGRGRRRRAGRRSCCRSPWPPSSPASVCRGWSSKLVQLRALLVSRDARALSLTTWLLAALTCGTRIVTTLAETGDVTMLTCFCVNLALNVLVVLAVVRFRDGPPEEAARKKAK